jgi:hypothetical protein
MDEKIRAETEALLNSWPDRFKSDFYIEDTPPTSNKHPLSANTKKKTMPLLPPRKQPHKKSKLATSYSMALILLFSLSSLRYCNYLGNY